MPAPILIGHRGSPTVKPENTIASFKEALDNGVNSIEFDVRAALDDIVVIHDGSVNRTTDGFGHVAEKTVAEIKELKSRGEPISTLEEVLEAFGDKCLKIFIEIKDTTEDIEEKVLRVIADSLENYDPIVIISFWPDILARVKELQPEIETGLLFQSLKRSKALLALTERIETDYLIGGRAMLLKRNAHVVTAAKERRFKVIGFGINSPRLVERAKILELDGIITDLPCVLQGIPAEPEILENLVDDGYIWE